jgi:hypothetical protein
MIIVPLSRYVLKNKDTDEVLLVVVFTLLHKEEAEAGDAAGSDMVSDKVIGGKEGSRHEGEKNFEPEADDLD